MSLAGQSAIRFTIRPMSQESAEAIVAWRYPPPYDFYNAVPDDPDLADLLDAAFRKGRYYDTVDERGELVGFFQFTRDVEPPEIGLGLRPDLTGQGLGLAFVQAGMAFAREHFGATDLSLAVTTFNRRAIAVYERAGFRALETYLHHTNGADWEFLRMTTTPPEANPS